MNPTTRPSDCFNDEDSNTSNNPSMDSVLAARLSRRSLLRGSVGTALVGGAALSGCATTGTPSTGGATPVTQLGFKPVMRSLADTVTVPPGYTAQVLYAGGDPLAASVPAFQNDGTDQQWAQRAGDHHDGLEWYGLDAQGKPSDTFTSRGLLAVNHEATTDEKLSSFFIHANGGTATLPRPGAEIDKELMIHGLSVVEVQRNGKRWATRVDSPYNRRITTLSEAVFTGPAAGSAHLHTKFSPTGTKGRGTVNNCGTGKTPWGTFVSGEENWFGYFFRDAQDDQRRNNPKLVAAFNRYGRKAGAPSRHGWESGGSEDRYLRWNTGAVGASPREDYRNEFHTFGYVVELDPYSPDTLLTKRTALGRFAHENVTFATPVAGEPIVAYMGCDARGEYIYKFVSTEKWDPADAQPRNRLAAGDKYLDQGTLFVARFNADGSGQWLELSLKNPAVASYSGFDFKTQADICVFTRLAADAAGATKMDRPEWAGVNPKNGDVYIRQQGAERQRARPHRAAERRRQGHQRQLQVGHLPVRLRGRCRQGQREPVQPERRERPVVPRRPGVQQSHRHLLDPDRRRRLHRQDQLHAARRPARPARRRRQQDADPRRPHRDHPCGHGADPGHAQALPGRPQGCGDHRHHRNARWPRDLREHPARGREHQDGRRERPDEVREPVAFERGLRRGQAPAFRDDRDHEERRRCGRHLNGGDQIGVSLATLRASHFVPWRLKFTWARASSPAPSTASTLPSPNLLWNTARPARISVPRSGSGAV
jgi:secreted PhoX family phosphatase